MSNSNYSIGLQRLKPVHTAYGAICMPIRKLLMHWHHSSTSQLCIYGDGPELVLGTSYKWPRLRRLPPKTETPKTEMLKILLEMRPRRDVGTSRDRDVKTETTTLCSKQRGFFH